MAVKVVNPRCIVNYSYWEVWGEQLDCRDCPLDCPCKNITVVKEVRCGNHKSDSSSPGT